MVPPKKLTKKLLTRWISKRHIRYPFIHCKDYNHLSSRNSKKLSPCLVTSSMIIVSWKIFLVCSQLIFHYVRYVWFIATKTPVCNMKLWFFISYEGINIFFIFVHCCRLSAAVAPYYTYTYINVQVVENIITTRSCHMYTCFTCFIRLIIKKN